MTHLISRASILFAATIELNFFYREETP